MNRYVIKWTHQMLTIIESNWFMGIHCAIFPTSLYFENFHNKVLGEAHEITGFPCSLKVCNTPLHFYKRPTLVNVFPNWKKPEEDFSVYQKKPSHTNVGLT